MIDRIPPNDPDAEMSVIGSLLIKPDVVFEVAPIIDATDFYDGEVGELYAGILVMHNEGVGIDAATLKARMPKTDAALLVRCGRAVANAAHAVYYARIVREKSTRRKLIHVATDAIQAAYGSDLEPLAIGEKVRNQLDAIEQRSESGSLIEAGEAITNALQKIAESRENNRSLGATTGVDEFDSEVGGLFPGELAILAARPGCGKTSLALQVAFDVAVYSRVLFASLEMSSTELVTRYLASDAEVDHANIRSNELVNSEFEKLCDSGERLKGASLFIDDSTQQTTASIRATAHRLKRRGGLSLVVVDYLGLVKPADKSVARHEQVGQIVADLKQIARECEVPVLALCQIRRETERSGNGGRPKLSDLRESGKIEEDADMVLFIHREMSRRDPDNDGKAELIVGKNRNGPTPTIELDWDASRTRFKSPSREFVPEEDGYQKAIDQNW